MAKKTVASLHDRENKSFTKVVRMFKSSKTGAYAFEERMIPADSVKDFLKK